VYSDQALNPYKIVHHDLHRRFPVHIEVDPTAFCRFKRNDLALLLTPGRITVHATSKEFIPSWVMPA
jgi:hypothetical protein